MLFTQICPINIVIFFNLTAAPLTSKNTFIVDMEYSPLVGGFGIVLNDNRAALLTASSLKFDPNVSNIYKKKK